MHASLYLLIIFVYEWCAAIRIVDLMNLRRSAKCANIHIRSGRCCATWFVIIAGSVISGYVQHGRSGCCQWMFKVSASKKNNRINLAIGSKNYLKLLNHSTAAEECGGSYQIMLQISTFTARGGWQQRNMARKDYASLLRAIENSFNVHTHRVVNCVTFYKTWPDSNRWLGVYANIV